MNLHLTLTFDWYDKTASGQKDTEYRLICPHWHRLIWNRRKLIKTVTFSRGMTKTMLKRAVWKIDKGPCPYDDWNATYYRVHFDEIVRF